MPLLLFLLCILITITSPHAHAATRLGLHVTTEEKAVWNARRTDTVGNIGGVTYKTMWDTKILPDANTFKAQGHPGGDGLWDGWTAAGCFPNGQRDTSFRPNGTKMMKSAFVFLVTGDTTYAAGVASNLLAQIDKIGTNWTNAGKWCRNIDNTVTMIDYLPWLTRLLYAYDYLIAGGYTGFTAANKTAIQTWFVNAALYWEHVVTTTVEKRYSTARDATPSYAVCDGVACPGGDISPTHWNSTNIARSFSTAWHNPTSLTASLMGSVGILANHAGLKNSATLFYKEFLRFSTWADGSIHDQSRWDDVPNVPNGVIRAWSHIYMQLQPMILLADHFARNNDASLYTYQSTGGQFGTGGGNVDLLTVVRWFSRMENNTLTPKVYGANIAGAVGEATRLQSKAQDFAREPVQIGNAMANIRFKNAEIETSYSGVLGADSGCGGFGGCSSGAWGLIPDMLFMFGNQETMEPYTTAPVKLAINATDVEVAQWNIRRVSGPYKAEWDDLKANADAFKASPPARYQGNTTNPAACYGTAGVTSPSRSQDEGLRDAAFVYFVTGDTTFLTAAKNALIAQAAVTGTKFENTAKWCIDANATITGLGNTVGSWLRKLAYAYGWIRSAITDTERSTLDTWFTNAGVYYYTGLDLTAVRRFPNRLADNYDLGNPPDAGSERGPLYIGGPSAWAVQGAWENDPMATNATMAVIGVILNNATMKDRATRYVKEWLKFNVYANGAIMDESRWGWGATSGAPQHGYLYSGQTIGSVLTTADLLLRDNYTNLFTYSTTDGMHGTAGGPKTILKAMQHFAGLTNGTVIERANIAGLTDAERIIDQTGTEQNRIEFINLAQGNLYYKDAASITAYTKPIPGTYDNVGCEALNGDWCTLPAVRFMYAGLEGISDPYITGAVTPAPIVVINVPTSAADYSSHIPVTTVSGTITGTNISSVAWHCDNCVVTDNTATFTPPSTFTVNGLQTNLGVNTVTITATNTSGLVGTDQITITLTTPGPDPTTGMIYRLAFEEGMGSSVIDSTGTQGPTSLTGGFSWQPGLFGAYAVQFDGTGVGTLPGLLGAPVSVTIQGHVQLTGPGDIEGGTLLNIGNYVGVRVYPGRIRAFYNVAGGTYSGLDFFTTIGAGWNHIAYTHNSTERKLYLNGFEVASASSSPLVWTGQGANTTIARHAQGLTTYDLQGKLDDVRVYNRVLSQADIQASIVGVPSPPLITITSPTTTGTFSTSSNTVSLSGSVSDNVTVTSVTVSCPQCNPALVDSPATITGSTWSKNSIVLGTAPSTNVFTVEATDNEGAQALTQLTVTYTIIPPTEGPACTRWASNNGSGNGLTVDTPYTIAAFLAAHSQSPGAVLCLKDGTYSGGSNLLITSTSFAGTSSNPITIRALNAGKVLINGGGSRPVNLQGSWGVLEGVNVTGSDNASVRIQGTDNTVRKVAAWLNSGTAPHIFDMSGYRNTLEDCVAFGSGEKILAVGSSGASQSGNTGNVVRRCWVRVEGQLSSQPGGATNGMEQGYGQDGITFENILLTWDTTGAAGSPTGALRSFRTQNSKLLGSLIYILAGAATPNLSEMLSAYTDGGSPPQGPPNGSCSQHPTTNTTYRDLVSFVQPGNPQFGSLRPFTFLRANTQSGCPTAPPGSGNTVTNILGVGGSSPSISSDSYTVTQSRHGSTLSAALSGSDHSNIWTLMPGLCKRYVNGTLTTTGLWPWSMNQRIKDALVAAGRPSIDVTVQMETLFGTIPEACKSGEVIEPPPPVATSLTLISQPTATNICPESGSVFQVGVLDQFGAPIGVSGLSVTLHISTNPSEAELVGTITVPTVSGIATFNNWCISLPGEGYKITALASGVTGITSSPFTVTGEAVGDRLMFIGTITGVPLYSTITPPITVHVINEDGLVDTTSTATITLSIYEPVGKEELTGTLVKDAVAGVAVFNNVTIAGTIRSGYAIKATSPGLAQGSTGVTVVSRVAMDQPMGSLSSTPLFILNRSR